jgi:hypothetical protein
MICGRSPRVGYEGAVSSDHDQQAQAVGLFLTDTVFANLSARTPVAALHTASPRVTVSRDGVTQRIVAGDGVTLLGG